MHNALELDLSQKMFGGKITIVASIAVYSKGGAKTVKVGGSDVGDKLTIAVLWMLALSHLGCLGACSSRKLLDSLRVYQRHSDCHYEAITKQNKL